MRLLRSLFVMILKPIVNRFFGVYLQRLVPLMVLLGSPMTALSESNISQSPITLPQAIERTLQQHPQLAIWTARQDEMQAHENMAASKERVVLDMSIEDALGTGDYSGIRSAQTTLQARWLLDGDQRAARVARVRSQREQLTLQQQLEALELSATTARYFMQLLAIDAQLALAQEAESETQKLVRIVQHRVNSGRAPDIELSQVKTRLAERRISTDEYQHQRTTASYQLSSQWAATTANLQTDGVLLRLPQLPSETEVLNRLNKAPLMQQHALNQRLFDADRRLANVEAKPQWTLGTGIRRFESNGDFALIAQASLPIGLDQKRTSYREILQARQRGQVQETVADRIELQTQLRALLLELQHSQHLIKSLNNDILPELDQARQKALSAWQRGQIGYQQWDNIRQQWLETRERLINEYLVMQLRWIELHRLTGSHLSA